MSSVSFTTSRGRTRTTSATAVSLPAHTLRRTFFILLFLLLVATGSYLYFLVETVRAVATRETLERDIASRSAALGAREAEYLRLSRLLTLEEASLRGLSRTAAPQIVHISRDGRLSMGTSLGR